jgi:hypothetical protein
MPREEYIRTRAVDARGKSLGLLSGANAQAADAFTNGPARMGWGTASIAEGAEYNLTRLTFNYWLLITLYESHWITGRIVDGPANDMVRAWPRLTSEIPPEDLTRIDRSLRRTQTKSKLLMALKWGRLFGGAGALIIIDGQEDMLEEPLDLDTIKPGSYRGLIPFDRWTGISPYGDVCGDISRPKEFNLPELYQVQQPGKNSFKVHASRILRFCGPDVPAPEKQVYQYWGISVIERSFEEIRKRDNMSWNILSLTFRASILAMKWKDMSQALSGASMNAAAQQAFYGRMQAINQLLSNQHLMILPEDGGLESINYSFAGVSDVYQQFQLDIAGAAETTVTRLFGRTLTGLGQSNDADERLYEQKIASDQKEQLEPQLEKLYPVICMSELGGVPDDLDFTFPSVRVLSEEEKAKLATDTTTSLVSLGNGGYLKRHQVLKELKQSSDVTGFGTNITDADIKEAEREDELGLGGLGEMAPAEDPTPQRAADAEWSESKHPRVEGGEHGGEFGSGGGGSTGGKSAGSERIQRARASAVKMVKGQTMAIITNGGS